VYNLLIKFKLSVLSFSVISDKREADGEMDGLKSETHYRKLSLIVTLLLCLSLG